MGKTTTREMRLILACALIAGAAHAEDRSIADHYGTFVTPSFSNTSYDQLHRLLLRGQPFVVTDGAKGLPMESWSCDTVQRQFPKSLIRQEGGRSDRNSVPMASDWPTKVTKFTGAAQFPEGAPKNRPFYWDIAKAFNDERERGWGQDANRVVKKLIKQSAVPYWLPQQDASQMGQSSEMWFHPKGAGALAHMDPHCQTTVSFCFSGARKWRMMLPPAKPHPEGYFDGQIYGVHDSSRKGEWQPTFELDAPAGSAILVYPGMIHETLSVGEECSSSISQTFAVPIAAAYFRAFWPRFALIHEDVGGCSHLVQDMVTLGSGARVPPGTPKDASKAADKFIASADANHDGTISEGEIKKLNRQRQRTIAELVAFHDVNEDGVVSTKEVKDSWVMYATSMLEVSNMMQGMQGRGDEGSEDEEDL